MADYYIDFDNGLDTNDGSTPAFALKNLCGTSEATGNAIFNPNAGDNLYLARGSIWNLSNRWAFSAGDEGASGNPVVIDAYDRLGETGKDKPIVESFQILETGDWIESGTAGVWYASAPVGTTLIRRVFYDMVGQKSGASSIATCTSVTPWWYDIATERLYVYSGSSVDNPSDTKEIRYTWTVGNAGKSVIFFQRCAYYRFNNINIRGGNNDGAIINNNLLSTDTGDIQFDSCDFTYLGRDGITVATTVAQDFVGNNKITNCLFDKKWTLNENTEQEYDGDGIIVNGGVNNNFIIEKNKVVDFTDTGIVITGVNGAQRSDGVIVRYNEVTAPITDYGRGIAVTAINNLVDNTKIYGNYIHDIVTRNQMGGRNTLFYANIIDTVRLSWRGDNHQGVSSVSTPDNYVDNVMIFQNIFINCYGNCIRLEDQNAYPIGSYTCRNNIAIASGTAYCIGYIENDVKGNISISNNSLYSASTDSVINWDSNIYTVQEAETNLTEMQDNIAEDPLIDSNYNLASSSPCVGAGVQWWVPSDPRPDGYNGEPFPDRFIDICANQSTWNPGHTKNL